MAPDEQSKNDDLEVPRQDALDSLRAAGFNASLSLVPYFGGPLSEFVTAGLAIKARARDERFFEAVAHDLQQLGARVDSMSWADVFDDDEFNANAHRLVAAARETADEDKRRLLAEALANSGSWSSVASDVERRRFIDLVIRLEPLHVAVLAYFRGPSEWLRKYGRSWSGPEMYMMTGVLNIIETHVLPAGSDLMPEVQRVIGELQRELLLVQFGVMTSMSGSGTVEPRISDFGRSFLDFLGESTETAASVLQSA